MRIVLAPRFQAQLDRHLAYGIEHFGRDAAERVFGIIRQTIFRDLPAHPRSGLYHPNRDIFERVVPKTPFVIYYRYNEGRDLLIMLAVFNQAEDHDAFEG